MCLVTFSFSAAGKTFYSVTFLVRLRRSNSPIYGRNRVIAFCQPDTPPHHRSKTQHRPGHCLSLNKQEARKILKMSDMEDDFMCDDEEDYDLVFTTKINFACASVLTVCPLSANSEVTG